ncbi:hypothetical protein [Neisseria sicca]|nr:hypothetical protein [Neisseria sicca]MBS5836330.1 hypothetical protein [Neisseria sp.]
MTAFCGGYSVECRCVGRRGEQAGFVRLPQVVNNPEAGLHDTVNLL